MRDGGIEREGKPWGGGALGGEELEMGREKGRGMREREERDCKRGKRDRKGESKGVRGRQGAREREGEREVQLNLFYSISEWLDCISKGNFRHNFTHPSPDTKKTPIDKQYSYAISLSPQPLV